MKGQIVGPFTLLTTLKDQQDRALIYNEELQDVVVKHLALKAKWQIDQLKTFARPVILFLDEPALAGFGSSAFIAISEELVQRLLREVVEAVHQAGALAGVHVCANTDWSLVFKSGVDVINFDAYNYFEKFVLYEDLLLEFLEKGHIVAWGMVPTNDPELIARETPEALAKLWLERIKQFVEGFCAIVQDPFPVAVYTKLWVWQPVGGSERRTGAPLDQWAGPTPAGLLMIMRARLVPDIARIEKHSLGTLDNRFGFY